MLKFDGYDFTRLDTCKKRMTYDGQPALIQAWLDFWIKFVSINPHLFARIVAIGETGIAIGLILGLFSNLAYAGVHC